MSAPTITSSTAACFYPRDADGHAYEVGDGTPHWQTASEGWRQLRSLREERGYPQLTLAREYSPCWSITCAECGYDFDQDAWLTHWPDRDSAVQAAKDSDWTVDGDRAYCWDCEPTTTEDGAR